MSKSIFHRKNALIKLLPGNSSRLLRNYGIIETYLRLESGRPLGEGGKDLANRPPPSVFQKSPLPLRTIFSQQNTLISGMSRAARDECRMSKMNWYHFRVIQRTGNRMFCVINVQVKILKNFFSRFLLCSIFAINL